MRKNIFGALACLFFVAARAQNIPVTTVPATNISAGSRVIEGMSISTQGASNLNSTSTVRFKASQNVLMNPGFRAGGYSAGGYFRANIENPFNLIILNPGAPLNTGEAVAKYDLFELGLDLPSDLTSRIDDYMANGPAFNTNRINPFNYDYQNLDAKGNHGISVEAFYKSPSGTKDRTIYGFYYGYTEWMSTGTYWQTAHVNPQYLKPWRIRFAPTEVGTWTCTITIKVDNSVYPTSQSFSFNVANSSNPGYVKKAPNNHYLMFDNGDTYFPNGDNAAWPSQGFGPSHPWPYGGQFNSTVTVVTPANPTTGEPIVRLGPYYKDEYTKFLDRQQAVKGNFTRLGVNTWNLCIEREKLGDYSDRFRDMQGIDDIFRMANDRGIYIAFFPFFSGEMDPHKGEVWADMRFGWPVNPYNNNANGHRPFNNYNGLPGVNDPLDIFTHSEPDPSHPGSYRYYGKEYLNRRFRYCVARWGYATNLAMWEVATEIESIFQSITDPTLNYGYDGVDEDGDPHNGINPENGCNPNTLGIAANWVNDICKFMKVDLGDPHLTTVSDIFQGDAFSQYFPQTSQPDHTAMFTQPYLDIISPKKYSPEAVGEAQSQRTFLIYQRLRNANGTKPAINKPVFMIETGDVDMFLDASEQVSYHNRIWSSSFSGYLGATSEWWTQQIYGYEPWNGNYISDGNNPTFYIPNDPTKMKEKNREALANFMQGVDLVNVQYEPFSRKSTSKWVESYYLKSTDQLRVLGWCHNRSYYINTLAATQPVTFGPATLYHPRLTDIMAWRCDPYWNVPINFTNPNNVPINQLPSNDYPGTTNYAYDCNEYMNQYTNGTLDYIRTLSSEVLRIPDLLPYTNYDISFYSTSGSGGLLYSYPNVSTDVMGDLYLILPTFSGTDQDYAFKIVESGSSFRQVSSSTSGVMKNSNIQVSPNPGNGKYRLSNMGGSEKTITVLDVQGREILRQSTSSDEFSIDISDRAKGIYLVKVQTGETLNNFRLVLQ